jgi:hypothetical protein
MMESNLTFDVIQNGVDAASIDRTEQPAITPEVPAIDPVEESAMKFTTLLPYVKKLGAAMPSQKGIIRVLHAFAEFPLGKEKPRLLTEGERQLFHVMQELQSHKSVVIQNIMKKNMEAQVLEQEVRRRTDEQLNATELPVAETDNADVGNN